MIRHVEFYGDGNILRGNLHLPPSDFPLRGILLIPGFADTAVGVHNLHVCMARSLERAGYAVLRFDYRGLGESEGDFREFTVSSGLDDVRSALQTLLRQPEIDPGCIGLIGFSLGGALAVQVARERPDAVQALGLLAPVAFMRQVFQSFFTEEHLRQAQENGWTDWQGWPVGEPFLRTVDVIDPLSAFAQLRLPTLVLQGDADTEVPQANAQAYADLGAEITKIRGCDHLFSSVRYQDDAVNAMTEWLSLNLLTRRKQA